jgi:hypothetical protein
LFLVFSPYSIYSIYSIIERLDQIHLYPNLEVPGLTYPGWESNLGLPRGKRAL